MTQETLDFVKEKTAALIAAHSCSAEAKAAAEKWLAAVGTAEEAEATKAYIAELEADIMPIDGLIAFAGSEAGIRKITPCNSCTSSSWGFPVSCSI